MWTKWTWWTGWTRTARVVRKRGKVEEIPLHPEIPGCSRGFDVIDGPLRERGCVTDGKIGNADSMLMRGLDLFDVVCEVLRERPSCLLCDQLDCEACVSRKATVGAAMARKNMKGT